MGTGNHKLDSRHRAQAVRLRARGQTFQEIGDRLGVTRQAVHFLLQKSARNGNGAFLRCSLCSRAIAPRPRSFPSDVRVLCCGCMRSHAAGSLGARLKALRSVAGLSKCELSRRTALPWEQIHRYECDRVPPTWRTLAKLIRVLGVGLVAVAG